MLIKDPSGKLVFSIKKIEDKYKYKYFIFDYPFSFYIFSSIYLEYLLWLLSTNIFVRLYTQCKYNLFILNLIKNITINYNNLLKYYDIIEIIKKIITILK